MAETMPAEGKMPAEDSPRQGKDGSVGQRLRNLRGNQSQRDFASLIGINKSSLGRYERGESYPDASDLQKICSKLDVNPEWLLFGGERKIYGGPKGRRKESTCKTCELLMRMLADETRARREQEQEIGKLVAAVAELKTAVDLLQAKIQYP